MVGRTSKDSEGLKKRRSYIFDQSSYRKLIGVGLLFFSIVSHAEVVERIVAVVNDDIILQTEVEQYAARLKTGTIADDLLTSDPKSLLGDRNKLIQTMVDEKVIDGEIKRKNLFVTIEQVEKEISKIASRNGISRAQLKQALKEQGTNFSDYQDFVKKRLERQSVIEQSVTSKIKISDEEIASYYMSKKGGQGAKESYEYHISHILFLIKDGPASSAEKRANNILERLKKGESFEKLASRYSEDPNYTTDGVLGNFKSGEFLKELEEAVKPLSPGQYVGPVKTKSGIHILKLLDKKIIADPQLESEKENIRQILYQQAFKKQFSFWLDQRRRESFIKVNGP